MRIRLFRDIALTVLVLLGLLMPLVAAGQDVAFGGWKEIGPGEIQRYAFRNYYDNTQPEDTEPMPALVLLKAVDATKSVNFIVNTAATLKLPKWADTDDDNQEEPVQPLGVGAPLNTGKHHDVEMSVKQEEAERAAMDEHGMFEDDYTMVWSGATKENVTFYVDVINSSPEPKLYKLSMTGPISILP